MRWWMMISAIALFVCTAFIGWLWPVLSPIFMFVWGVIIALISYRSLEHGLGIMAIDLLIDPMGRLLSSGWLSFRMVMFGILVVVWIVRMVRQPSSFAHHFSSYRRLYLALCLFFVVLSVSVAVGVRNGYPLSHVINDANGYIFFLLIPVVLHVHARHMMSYISAGFAWLLLQSAFLFAWFSHVSRPYFDTVMYRFFRDTRVAEITPLADQGVRIFLQSHIFAALGLVALIVGRRYLLERVSRNQYVLLLSACTFLVLMSMSRSLWLGVGVMIMWFMYHYETINDFFKAGILSVSALALLFFMPVGHVGNTASFIEMFAARGEVASEYAAVSRWIMLPQLNTFIVHQPLFGYGFGFSADIEGPKNVRMRRSTFEWGWHDVMIKVGALGFLVFAWLLYEIVMLVRKSFLIASIISLLLIHIFTPYVNHPLGIGWLLGCLMFGIYLRRGSETSDT